ncbi:MAG TPA: GMC oxidoreductase [Ilumatobacteraceae bacterium]|nr:GMC oxidoreductase [Ilumatobacteraceae bacterium]
MTQAIPDVAVIGSGPAGAAAARALTTRGRTVVMIDVGHDLPQVAGHSQPVTPPVIEASGFGRKLAFGSDYPYRPVPGRELLGNDTDTRPSYALGGYSSVWGATMLPLDVEDLSDWPIGAPDLAASYREVATYVPIAASPDGLSARYPLYGAGFSALRPSHAGQLVLDRLEARRLVLTKQGVEFGRSRLAVVAGRPAPCAGCSYCGQCLTGCPYSHIYNSAETVRELMTTPSFIYRSGLYVLEVGETEHFAMVRCCDVATGNEVIVEAKRVFVAAGSIETPAILQRSRMLGPRVRIRDSQVLVLPVALLGSLAPATESTYALSQVFFRLQDTDIGARPVQVQLYGHDSSMVARARALHPRLSQLLGPLLGHAMRPLLVAFVYLHSDFSDQIECHTTSAGTQLLRVPNPDKSDAVRSIVTKLQRVLVPCGLIPLRPLMYEGVTGQSYHTGGSLPMRRAPLAGETDVLGRPAGSSRVHVVDASVFPSIAAGPITFTIMANATRIARSLASTSLSVSAASSTADA